MANEERFSPTATVQRGAERTVPGDETEDIIGGSARLRAASATPYRAQAKRPSEGQFVVGEVAGDASVIVSGTEAGAEADQEVGSAEGTETGEEYIEATS